MIPESESDAFLLSFLFLLASAEVSWGDCKELREKKQ